MNILLADSRPLFHSPVLHPLLLGQISHQAVNTGIYIGAANHDDPEFYALACGAFDRLGLNHHHHLKRGNEQATNLTLQPAIIILSGGRMNPGWDYLSQPKIRQWLDIHRSLGSMFIGISAGAIHLASGLDDSGRFQTYLHWVKTAIAVHEEAENWPSVQKLGQQNITNVMAIPFNDGLITDSESFYSLHGHTCRHVMADKQYRQVNVPVIGI